jgi:hypothetical protein
MTHSECNKRWYARHKEQILAKNRRYYQEHKEQCKECMRRWRENNPERKLELTKQWRENSQKYPESHKKDANNYRTKYPERCLARQIAEKKIQLENLCCSACGSQVKLERHHPDYSKPLRVIILCEDCHKKLHKNGGD